MIRVWCSLVCTPVLGTGSRRFKSYHSDLWVVMPSSHKRKAERICSRLLSGIIHVQPLDNPSKCTPVTQLVEVPNLKFGSCWFESSQGYTGMEQQWLGRLISYTSASAILAPVTSFKLWDCRLMDLDIDYLIC
jgi:hypothetical protein